MESRGTRPLVLVTVGSDKHPFDRLIGWVDDVLDAIRDLDCRYVSQHGTSPRPRSGDHHAFLGHDRLQHLMVEATVVISHGGPGTLTECLRLGRKPVAVPRLAALGEAVDDHQTAFCRFLADREEALVPTSVTELGECVAEGIRHPESLSIPVSSRHNARRASVERFAEAMRSRPQRGRRHRGLLVRRLPLEVASRGDAR